MSEYTCYWITLVLYSFIGGCGIGIAIDDYKKNHYICCGFWTMTALSMILAMAKFIFTN